MTISKEYYNTLEGINWKAIDIPMYQAQINNKLAMEGEDASPDLLELANFLNGVEANAFDMVAQGATFNFSDEIKSKFSSYPPSFYSAVENNAMNVYRRKKPITSTVAQVGGALIPTALDVAYNVVGRGRNKKSLFPESPLVRAISDNTAKVKNLAMGGPKRRSGIYGTVYSIGSDEGPTKERVSKYKPYITGLISAAASIPLIPVSKIFGAIAERVASFPVAEKGEAMAIEMVEEAMISDAGSVEEALLIAHNKLNSNKPLTLADVGPNTGGVLDLVNLLPSKGVNVTKQFLEERNAGRFGRLNTDLQEAYGVNASYFDTLDALIDTRKRIAAPLYEKAYIQTLVDESGNVVETRPRTINLDQEFVLNSNEDGKQEVTTLNQLLERPIFKRAFASAEQIALNDGVQLPDFEMQDIGLVITSGPNKGGLVDEVDLQFLHYMKLALDNEVSIANKPLNTSMGNVELGQLMNNKEKFLTILDSNEDYKVARKSFAGSKAVENAMELGLDVFTKKTYAKNVEKLVRQMNASEREAFRNGAFEAILRKMEESSDGGNIGKKIIGSERNRNLLRLTFPDSMPKDAFDDFINNFTSEMDMRALEVRVLSGSQTASREAIRERVKIKAARSFQSRDLTPKQLVDTALQQDFALLTDEQNTVMSEKLADILTETEYDRLVKQLQKGFKLGEALGRVNPMKLANYFLALSDLTGSPYLLGDTAAEITRIAEEASLIDFEEFGDEAKQKAIDYFTKEESLDSASLDNFDRTVPSSVSEKVRPVNKESLASQLDTMLANVSQSNMPLVSPANAVTPQAQISETVLPNPKDRELAERLRANNSGIGGLA